MYTFIKDHEGTKLHWFFKILCWGILIHKLQKETKTPAIVLPSLSLGEEENFGRETPGEQLGISSMAPNCNIIQMSFSSQGPTDLWLCVC